MSDNFYAPYFELVQRFKAQATKQGKGKEWIDGVLHEAESGQGASDFIDTIEQAINDLMEGGAPIGARR